MSPFWIAILVVLGVVFVGWLVSLIWGKPWSINHFYTRVFLESIFDSPETLTMMGILEKFGIHGYNAKFSDSSDAHEVKQIGKMKRVLKTLRSYDRSRQNEVQLMSTDVLDWYIDDQLRGERYRHYSFPLNQLFGEQSNVPDLMMNMHPLKTRRDAQNYIKRLSKFGIKFDQILEGLQIREGKGLRPPNFTVKHVLAEMKAFAGQPAEENPLYTVFEEKMTRVGIKESVLDPMLATVREEIEKTVYPAYQKLIDNFTALEVKATVSNGVWAMPDGDAYYVYSLRHYTTTNLTPDEIHEIGLKEVARIEGEMSAILERNGHPGGNPTRLLLELNKEDRFLYPNSDEGRAACLSDYTVMLEEVDRLIEPAFELRPTSRVEVQRIPEFKEATSPGAYYLPSDLAGGRPGVFYANLRDMKDSPKFSMRTLAHHEAIPGHHFQISIAMGLKDMPLFRKMFHFTAYSEGWAMYAENLASDLGIYMDEPYGELGFLDSILFRAVRLVVDTGIHYKRWTREQAIEYMEAHTGQTHERVVSEIERYFVYPGQACSFKMGELKVLALRQKAKVALGDKFDLREFHNVILGQGAMPLTLLEKSLDSYIASVSVD